MRYFELKAKRPQILAAMREWETEYYDSKVNYLQLQAGSRTITVHNATITVHNAVLTINPAARFTNKITFNINTRHKEIELNRCIVRTDPVYGQPEAVESLRKKLEAVIFEKE